MAKVPIGATLEWVDDRSKTCTVVDQKNHVEYEGKQSTISGLAKDIRGSSSAQGSLYWMYAGETSQERRERFEREAADDDS